MIYLYAFFGAMVISMTLIPLFARLAPHMGLLDLPDPRKVHASPVPRVGGLGIVIGALASMAMWVPFEKQIITFLIGSCVLLIFGVWDDRSELGHYTKFLGQALASVLVVYGGDIYVSHFPFMGLDELSPAIGKPFTVFALVGMINAINHSDGLDGLAGGISFLSLACIAYLAHIAGGIVLVVIAFACIGGIFGFLRYNTHPARVFMGDGGSQFLGFALGVSAVLLTQEINPALSPMLPLLILGLPIADILGVLVQRIYHGMNWFRASRNHIHHRLLALGYAQREAVVFIYSIQLFLVLSAVLLQYHADLLILGLYLGVCAAIFVLLSVLEKRRWHAHSPGVMGTRSGRVAALLEGGVLSGIPAAAVKLLLPIFFLAGSMLSEAVPRDVGILSAVLAGLFLLHLILGDERMPISARGIIYVAAACMVYLGNYFPLESFAVSREILAAYIVFLALCVGLVLRYARDIEFGLSTMDYLVVAAVVAFGVIGDVGDASQTIGILMLEGIAVFYACEIVISRMKTRWNGLNLSVVAALFILAFRGLVS